MKTVTSTKSTVQSGDNGSAEEKSAATAMRESILAEITRGDNLLSLPATLAKVLEVINNDDASIETLAAAIQKDPSLTATVIRVANSPYYGRMARCSSLSDAVMTLGSLTMKSIALTATALNPKHIQEQCGINPEEFVANSITVATMAREIAVATNYRSPEDALTAGLLHDIGILYFMGNHTEKYSEVTTTSAAGKNLNDAEREVFGLSHMEVGEALLRKWHLPDLICRSVSGHHHNEADDNPAESESTTAGEENSLITIVRLAVSVSGDSYLQYRRNLECDLHCVSDLMRALHLSDEALSKIVTTVLNQSMEIASGFGMDASSVEKLLAQANKKLGQYLNSLQRLMRDREELSAKILTEERRKGVAESRVAIMATLSHHINNSAMVAMGKAEALSVILCGQLPKDVHKKVSRDLQTIAESIEDIKNTLEEMSHVADNDIMAVHDKSNTLDLNKLIKDSARLETSVLPLSK